MHTTNTRRWLATGAIAFLATIASASTLQAQTPTAEGTIITNVATASWSDANNNTYTPVTAQASVTVGYLAAPDVTSPATVTPASPSTSNIIPFLITNTGNGTDQFSVNVSGSTGITITGYTIGAAATVYTDLTSLNAALAAADVAAAGAEQVNVVYTVAPGRGGLTSPVTLTATSVRTPAATGASDASITNVIPTVSAAVAVTPDNGTASRLPSNGTQYSQTYTVTNNGNASDTYTLGGSAGAALTIVSVNGTAGTGSSVTIAAGGSANVTVVYTVGNVAAGTTANLSLGATSANNASISDGGNYTITVVRPAITMAKVAFLDDQTTAITATDRVLPGQYIQYRITVTNSGTASANTVAISDPLPTELTYASATGDAAGWTINEASGTVSASLTGTLAVGASRSFWVRVQVR